jgi:hypothetical protein
VKCPKGQSNLANRKNAITKILNTDVQGFIRGKILSLPPEHNEHKFMREHKKRTRQENEFLKGKVRHTKHTWVCHKTKGSHLFELDFPPYTDSYRAGQYKEYFKDAQCPKDFYEAYEKWVVIMNAKEKETGSHYKWGQLRLRYYKCVLCGKKASDDDNNPDKRIREAIKK